MPVRFNISDNGIVPSDDGKWVSTKDYDALAERYEQLAAVHQGGRDAYEGAMERAIDAEARLERIARRAKLCESHAWEETLHEIHQIASTGRA